MKIYKSTTANKFVGMFRNGTLTHSVTSLDSIFYMSSHSSNTYTTTGNTITLTHKYAQDPIYAYIGKAKNQKDLIDKFPEYLI